jgi:hypothetical protein
MVGRMELHDDHRDACRTGACRTGERGDEPGNGS